MFTYAADVISKLRPFFNVLGLALLLLKFTFYILDKYSSNTCSIISITYLAGNYNKNYKLNLEYLEYKLDKRWDF